jgi:hypothetical protein
MNPKPSRFLRIVMIVLLSMTAAVTLLGAIGTTCVAFFAENFGPRMAVLVPVKPIFQALVFISLAAGIYGVISITRLGKGRQKAYLQTLIFLIIGLVTSGVQFYYSLTLRGSTAPNNMRLYLTAFTLVSMLLLRLPGIWQRTGFGSDASATGKGGAAGGLAMMLCGLATMTTPIWAYSSHFINGSNTVNVLFWPLILCGGGLILIGAGHCFLRDDVRILQEVQHLPETLTNID